MPKAIKGKKLISFESRLHTFTLSSMFISPFPLLFKPLPQGEEKNFVAPPPPPASLSLPEMITKHEGKKINRRFG